MYSKRAQASLDSSSSMMDSSSPFANRRRPHRLQAPTPRAGASTAQAGLAKIMAIISTACPPPSLPSNYLERCYVGDPEASRPPVDTLGFGTDADLRLRLAPSESGAVTTVERSSLIFPVTPAGASISPSASVVGADALKVAKRSGGKCNLEDQVKIGGNTDKDRVVVVLEEDVKEVILVEGEAGLNRDKATSSGSQGGGGGGSIHHREGYLDLLLEAARQVSGGLIDDDPEKEEEKSRDSSPIRRATTKRPSAAGAANSKRKEVAEWAPFDLYEETAPIVRSKRGRSQALPSRYRDSVLEPWGKLPSVSRHQGRTTAANP